MKYRNGRWKRKRQFILKRDSYLCQESIRYGKKVPANTVHHIYPVESYPELAYESWNLISLSQDKHNEMHDRKSHNLTAEGRALQKRFEKKYLNWCKENNCTPHFK